MNSYIITIVLIIKLFNVCDGVKSSYCTDYKGITIHEGQTFSPLDNPCKVCRCVDYKPTDCDVKQCTDLTKQDCGKYFEGRSCCAFFCRKHGALLELNEYLVDLLRLGPRYTYFKDMKNRLLDRIHGFFNRTESIL